MSSSELLSTASATTLDVCGVNFSSSCPGARGVGAGVAVGSADRNREPSPIDWSVSFLWDIGLALSGFNLVGETNVAPCVMDPIDLSDPSLWTDRGDRPCNDLAGELLPLSRPVDLVDRGDSAACRDWLLLKDLSLGSFKMDFGGLLPLSPLADPTGERVFSEPVWERGDAMELLDGDCWAGFGDGETI